MYTWVDTKIALSTALCMLRSYLSTYDRYAPISFQCLLKIFGYYGNNLGILVLAFTYIS